MFLLDLKKGFLFLALGAVFAVTLLLPTHFHSKTDATKDHCTICQLGVRANWNPPLSLVQVNPLFFQKQNLVALDSEFSQFFYHAVLIPRAPPF